MPGPTNKATSLASDSAHDLTQFESCEDMSEPWFSLNGNLSQESIYHDCTKYYHIECQSRHVNGSDLGLTQSASTGMLTKEIAQTEKPSKITKKVVTERQVKATGLSRLQECFEQMEVEDEEGDEVVETINVPVVEASLSVDLNTSLTRQKIASVQRGRTLSYVDKDDPEDAPTRRPRPLAHVNESIDIVMPLNRPTAYSGGAENDQLSPNTCRNSRVFRNPSYHFAVRDTISSPRHEIKTGSLDQDNSSFEDCLSCEEYPINTVTEDKEEPEGSKRHLSTGDEITLPLAANMPRSVSFCGPVKLSQSSPSTPASGSLSEGNSRSGSASQLPVPTSKFSSPQTPIPSPVKESPTIVRGSAISRSFRRLFSSPARTTPTSPPEEIWPDIPDTLATSPTTEAKTPSRLRKLGSTISRRLPTRSKMSEKTTSAGTNGHQLLTLNGTPVYEDSQNLVEYETLLKLFCCSGCQAFMAPPLHQCRKGHLVCGTCRLSLKQTCPVCKQRFADSTNLMMEQVCQLVKFPCKYACEGCPEYHRPRAKLDHEHFCLYRPVHCHHGPKGCPKVVILRDMQQHLDECIYKNK
nr:uncharacterized protein LOC123764337 [Procambarus clarkii]